MNCSKRRPVPVYRRESGTYARERPTRTVNFRIPVKRQNELNDYARYALCDQWWKELEASDDVLGTAWQLLYAYSKMNRNPNYGWACRANEEERERGLDEARRLLRRANIALPL